MRISEQVLREGTNNVLLSVRGSDGTSQDINFSVDFQREEVTLPPAGKLISLPLGWLYSRTSDKRHSE